MGELPGFARLVVSFSFLFPSYLSSLCYIEDNASFKYGGVSQTRLSRVAVFEILSQFDSLLLGLSPVSYIMLSSCNLKNFEKNLKKKEKEKAANKQEKGIYKSWDRPKTRKGGLGKKQVVRKALGLGKIGI